jgi:hypothetical protein
MYISVVLTNTLYKPKWNKNNIVKNLFLSVNVEVYFLHKAEKTFVLQIIFLRPCELIVSLCFQWSEWMIVV